MMDTFLSALVPFQGVLLALALGLLIGVERGWSHRNAPDGARVAGIRTYALIGLAGGMAGEVWAWAPALAAVLLGTAAILILIGYVRSSRDGTDVSATSAVVGVITLGTGLCAAAGWQVLASVIAAVTMLLLSSRQQLHAWLNRLNETEVRAIARFGLISLAILPVLPDAAMGPYDAWNPRQIWLVVVLVSGLSFAGYAATRVLGESRGLLATAAAGAVVSSTAVTASLASRMRHAEGEDGILVAGAAVASAVMFLRVLGLTAMLAPFALPALAMLTAPAVVVSVGAALWCVRRSARPETNPAPAPAGDGLPVQNPFELKPALILAGLVVILSLLARWLLSVIGQAGLAVALAISGMVDVDSAIITMGGLPRGAVDGHLAGLILATPVLLNTLVKAGVAISIGGWRRGGRMALPLVLSLVAGIAVLPFVIWQGGWIR